MYGNQSFERLDFIGKDGLPVARERCISIDKLRWSVLGKENGHGLVDPHFHAGPEGLGRLVVPCVDDACSDMFA